jgi:hypothetical protein
MPRSAPELKSVREHLCQARELVGNAFSTTRAGRVASMANMAM